MRNKNLKVFGWFTVLMLTTTAHAAGVPAIEIPVIVDGISSLHYRLELLEDSQSDIEGCNFYQDSDLQKYIPAQDIMGTKPVTLLTVPFARNPITLIAGPGFTTKDGGEILISYPTHWFLFDQESASHTFKVVKNGAKWIPIDAATNLVVDEIKIHASATGAIMEVTHP